MLTVFKTTHHWLFLAAILVLAAPADRAHAEPLDVPALSLSLFADSGTTRQQAIDRLVATKDKSLIPTFVMAMRWTGDDTAVAAGLSALTGTNIKDWHQAYEWQEAHPNIVPHASFRPLKLRFLGNTDGRFLEFFEGPGTTRAEMKVRLEEVTWGGVLVDGIPALDNPKMLDADQADYLLEDDLVFGISINGDSRAYPLRIMGWHEMLNDVVGGVPVALAYCTLCGAGILFDTKLDGQAEPFVFGSSGLLFRSNKLMYDRQTNSLWNQFTGKPVTGKLASSGIELRQRPVVITTWKAWRELNPETRVLSLDTGYIRNYGSGITYKDYFASPDLMFPARIGEEGIARRKDYVFGLRDVAAAKAWPIKAFLLEPVINDHLGTKPIVLIGNGLTRSVRAYARGNEVFEYDITKPHEATSQSGTWKITEKFLLHPNGQRLPRLPGHVSFWFAWDNYLGLKSEIYKGG